MIHCVVKSLNIELWIHLYNGLICQIQVECSGEQEGGVEADDGGRKAEEADGVQPEQDPTQHRVLHGRQGRQGWDGPCLL